MADDELRKLFAIKLNQFLEANKYNQADLARHMHVSTATTAKWCTGQTIPRIDRIQSICNWLGIEKSDLLEDNAVNNNVNLSCHERDLIINFRKSDELTKQMVLRLLNMEPANKENTEIA